MSGSEGDASERGSTTPSAGDHVDLAAERRASPRLDVHLWVEDESPEGNYFQYSANLSAGGMYLERTVPHRPGTVVTLQFTLPGDSEPLRVQGEIVKANLDDAELGMGVKFVEPEPEVAARIGRFVAEQQAVRAKAE